MELLERRIAEDGEVCPGNILKAGSFLNQQLDIGLLREMGREWKHRFAGTEINKILTIEASGIGIACIVAQYFGVPVVFAKKSPTVVQSDDVVQAPVYSFTHKCNNMIRVDKHYLPIHSNVLIVDDFLADGQAASGMISLCEQLDCKAVGVGIGIEKGFQPGGRLLREKGVKLKSLAVVEKIEDGKIFLAPDDD